MQITIVQAEIEQAITDFIHRQINVRDGMLIQIELKATRGDHGFQAVIDIVDPNSTTVLLPPNRRKQSLSKQLPHKSLLQQWPLPRLPQQ